MAEVVYVLCALTSLACAFLLLRSYRRVRLRLTLLTSVCFVLLATQNVLLFVDLVIIPDARLVLLRNVIYLCGVGVLFFGLVTEAGRSLGRPGS